jgi:hypothetical protein
MIKSRIQSRCHYCDRLTTYKIVSDPDFPDWPGHVIWVCKDCEVMMEL